MSKSCISAPTVLLVDRVLTSYLETDLLHSFTPLLCVVPTHVSLCTAELRSEHLKMVYLARVSNSKSIRHEVPILKRHVHPRLIDHSPLSHGGTVLNETTRRVRRQKFISQSTNILRHRKPFSSIINHISYII